jgi:chorismate mutase-like protein
MNMEEAVRLLTEYRDQIDVLDLEILALLNRRTRVVERIGEVKQKTNMPVYEPQREEEVFRNVTENNGGPLSPEAVKRVFERIIDEMRTVQRERMLKSQAAEREQE